MKPLKKPQGPRDHAKNVAHGKTNSSARVPSGIRGGHGGRSRFGSSGGRGRRSPSGSRGGRNYPAVGAGLGTGLAPPAPTTVAVSITDTVVPTTPDVTADKI